MLIKQAGKPTNTAADVKHLTNSSGVKPESLMNHLIIGRINETMAVTYKCTDLLIRFGNLQVFNGAVDLDEKEGCGMPGNYLGK